MPFDPDTAEVRAAGGVVYRRDTDGAIELALIHRPRYDDWSLPKGKLDKGESFQDAAVREVEEEIGARCELGPELRPIEYHDSHGRAKAVRYWLMEANDAHTFEPSDEVDEVRWPAPKEAFTLLTYERDRALVAEALELLGA